MSDREPTSGGAGGAGSRGLSELVGVLLLFGMVIVVAAIIVVSGASSVDSMHHENRMVAAEMSMQEFRSEVSTLAYGNGSATKFQIALDETERVSVVEDGSIHFRINGRSACSVSRTLGTVQYEAENGDVVAYQANGVWKKTGSSSIMVDPPNVEYSTKRVAGKTMHTFEYRMTNVNVSESDLDAADTIVVRPADGGQRSELREQLCIGGSRDDVIDKINTVSIAIRGSTFYDAWARYFRSEFGPDAEYRVYDSNDTVVVEDVPMGLVDDKDNDGVANGNDNCVNVPNQRQWDMDDDGKGDACDSDADGDGVPDDEDNCPETPNPDQAEYDGDAYGAACDDDVANDDDGDGVRNAYDNCPNTPNANQINTDLRLYRLGYQVTPDYLGDACDSDDDGDGVPDSQDPNSGRSTSALDVDNDGVINGEDNCPETANHAQANADDDGKGDACDPDDDDDGVPDDRDNCPSMANPDQEDVCSDDDGDGVPNGDDDCPDTQGVGANGCAPLGRDDGSLVVNQTSASVTFLGTEAAGIATANRSERPGGALDVMFVLDKTRSMGGDHAFEPGNETDLDPEHWNDTADRLDWSDYADVESGGDGSGRDDHRNSGRGRDDHGNDDQGDDEDDSWWGGGDDGDGGGDGNDGWWGGGGDAEVSPGNVTVPDGELWRVQRCSGGSCNVTLYEPGDDVSLEQGDAVSRAETTVTVPDDEVWRIADGDGDASNGTVRLVGPGQTVDATSYEWLQWDEDDGNDPLNLRVDATRAFVDALSADNGDRAGWLAFNETATVEHALSNDLDGIEASVYAEAAGQTDIGSGIQKGTARLADSGGPKQDVIVLLSDGRNREDLDGDGEVGFGEIGDMNDKTIDAAEAAAEENVTIYTVALGEEADTQILKSVAKKTGGKTYSVDSATRLESVFGKIAEREKNRLRSQRIERKYVTGELDVDGATDYTENLGSGNLNDADGDEVFQTTVEFTPGSRFSLSSTAYECDAATSVGDLTNPNTGETYNETACTTDGATLYEAGDQVILTDGDEVPDRFAAVPWFERDLATLVNDYDGDLIEDGEFELGSSEAILVAELSDGRYTAVLVSGTDDDGSSPGPVGPGGDEDGSDDGEDEDGGSQADQDHDGIPDDEDNCPTIANYGQGDIDGDGNGNACDESGESDGGDDDDSDGDGVPDSSDNCPNTANHNQADSDQDGKGNACDYSDDDHGLGNNAEGDDENPAMTTGNDGPIDVDDAGLDAPPDPDNLFVITIEGQEVVVDEG